MKLAVLALILGLAIPSVSQADTLNPPGGPVYVDDDAGPPRAERPDRGPRGQGQRDPRAVANRQKLRQALLAQFDANGDGKLGPRERMRAVRVLRRIEQRLATAPQARGGQGQGGDRAGRDGQYRRFMKRYDVNGDGQVGPKEVPSGAADRLRKFDRNGDGWVDPNELR